MYSFVDLHRTSQCGCGTLGGTDPELVATAALLMCQDLAVSSHTFRHKFIKYLVMVAYAYA